MRDVASKSLTFLWLALSSSAAQIPLGQDTQHSLTFYPRHVHHSDVLDGSTPTTLTLFHDIRPPSAGSIVPLAAPTFRTRKAVVHKPRSQEAFQRARLRSLYFGQTEMLAWDEDEVLVPDVTDRGTILELAKLAGNAYQLPGAKNWYDVHERWNTTIPFGWDEGNDGLRGNVFSTRDNSTIILSIKGTTLWGGGNTSKRDKLNDNLLFSCCCARVGWAWSGSQVCDCYNGRWTCDNTCVEKALMEDSLFYSVGVNLYNNLTYMYPDANIWIVGHSLGGALASLLGATFGAPTVTFEAPGERLAARRLHLPESPSLLPITHVYHTGDPVPLGTCNGFSSICSKAGYAMESRCHLGKSIVYDTVSKLGWRTHLANHPIHVIITNVLNADWEEDRPVPEAVEETDCVDCFKWEFA